MIIVATANLHKAFHRKEVLQSDADRAQRVATIEQLARKITEFTGHMNAATHHLPVMITEFDRLKDLRRHGARRAGSPGTAARDQ